MTTDSLLIQKREDLKRRLTAGEYKTLVDVFLAWTNRMIQKTTRQTKPLPTWQIIAILIVVVMLINIATMYGMGLPATRNLFEFLGLDFKLGVLWLTAINALFFIDLALINQYVNRILIFWREHALDATESVLSLEMFEDWLEGVCNKRLHFFITITGGTGGAYFIAQVILQNIHSIATGTTFGIIVITMVSFAAVYQIWMGVLLSIRLRQYQIKLFIVDPGNSEFISRLSNRLSFLVYIVAISSAVGALLTLAVLVSKLRVILGITQLVFLWLPIIFLFTLNQTSLASIIRRAKWKTLNEIQSQVEELRSTGTLKDKETIEAINRLMDFHDRVKATRNSAIDSSTIVNFINSLLLPLLAFLLGNLDKVLPLFARKP